MAPECNVGGGEGQCRGAGTAWVFAQGLVRFEDAIAMRASRGGFRVGGLARHAGEAACEEAMGEGRITAGRGNGQGRIFRCDSSGVGPDWAGDEFVRFAT
jgi:hypothetical protein